MMDPAQEETKDMTRVSVIIPFIDGSAAFLAEAIESVLSQNYGNMELLLVNDGATGECRALAHDYQDRHPGRVRVVAFEGGANRGTSAARNLGLRHASGEVVAFLDADDVWLPGKLQEQVALLEKHPEAGILYGNTRYWYGWTGRPEDRDRDFVPRAGLRLDRVVPPRELLPGFLSGRYAVPCTCSFVVRRDLLEQVGGSEESFRGRYEDQVLYAKVSLVAPTYVADACWDRYRQHPVSMTAAGEADPREIRARTMFLEWLADYLDRQEVTDPAIRKALRLEKRLLRLSPGVRRWVRRVRKARWRVDDLFR
jgi:glycosyltransferase involved in cell wall biosynthesis